ncbi:hypothetical protein GCM10017624_27210 [Azotobacter vinelandii]|nr:hypothetical protein GCM10017624_27210 [Azotobacter vinelandii]
MGRYPLWRLGRSLTDLRIACGLSLPGAFGSAGGPASPRRGRAAASHCMEVRGATGRSSSSEMVTSTRRFMARPAGLALLVTG